MIGRRGYPFFILIKHKNREIEHGQPYLDRKTLAVARFAPHHPYLPLMIPGSRWSLRHSYYPYYRDPLDGKGEDDILPISLLPTS